MCLVLSNRSLRGDDEMERIRLRYGCDYAEATKRKLHAITPGVTAFFLSVMVALAHQHQADCGLCSDEQPSQV